jgi:hypothetical protein
MKSSITPSSMNLEKMIQGNILIPNHGNEPKNDEGSSHFVRQATQCCDFIIYCSCEHRRTRVDSPQGVKDRRGSSKIKAFATTDVAGT